ncbi:hypothetical protein Dsin_031303 [Dipteronia sinensis]|uniref:Uncharacterized protein n=1 Tax=Dipteronia sinensis TaxID=43782 RepID=A0AAD9ZL03_9ROSI|nr:hypothetical protein Dsin_031303 [Dipteronia sinensis]
MTRWAILGSELYSIQPIRSKDLFENNGHLGQIYKGQMFKDKKTLKGALGMHPLKLRVGKLRNVTYWHVTFVDNVHTYGDSGNYNVDFHRVSCHVIGELFSRSFADPGCNLHPKDIICDMRDKHNINLSYNKAYKSKDHALHSIFSDPWESFNMLPVYFHMLVRVI